MGMWKEQQKDIYQLHLCESLLKIRELHQQRGIVDGQEIVAIHHGVHHRVQGASEDGFGGFAQQCYTFN